MSFSSKVKEELCALPIISENTAMTELCSVVLFGGYIKKNTISLLFENEFSAQRVWSLIEFLNDIYCFSAQYCAEQKSDSKCFYEIKISKNIDVFKKYIYQIKEDKKLLPEILRGAFIACGSINNPDAGYHLEFNLSSAENCNILNYFLRSNKTIKIKTGIIIRRNNHVLYVKDSEKIIDILVIMGAKTRAMKFIQLKMIKEARNNINRVNNFEIANISKAAESATNHIEAIKKIKQAHGLQSLSDVLLETAEIRMAHPYSPLSELIKFYKSPISKSGINHRLKKIMNIAENL